MGVLHTEAVFKFIGTIVEKLKIKEVIVGLLVAGIVILFAPDSFIGILGLQIWRDTYRSYIGAAVLIFAVLCLIWVIIWIKNKIFSTTFAYRRVSREYLKKIISDEEKEFLITNFYNSNRGEFDSTSKLDITSGNVYLLQNACIIAPSAKASTRADRWAYCLQPNVRLYLNKAIRKKNIVITSSGYRWRL